MKKIFVFLILIFFLGCLQETRFVVTKVVDGDTIWINDVEKVRLIGIDTPEIGQPGYSEARDYLKNELLDKTVYLETGLKNKDQYGRLLRYMFFEDRLINLELVRLGYAKTYLLEPTEPYSQELLDAEKQAQIEELGIWKK